MCAGTSGKRNTAKTTSQKTRRIGNTRTNHGVRLTRPAVEVLGSKAIHDRQVAEAQHLQDHVRGKYH